jgi:hypothetical protein
LEAAAAAAGRLWLFCPAQVDLEVAAALEPLHVPGMGQVEPVAKEALAETVSLLTLMQMYKPVVVAVGQKVLAKMHLAP